MAADMTGIGGGTALIGVTVADGGGVDGAADTLAAPVETLLAIA